LTRERTLARVSRALGIDFWTLLAAE